MASARPRVTPPATNSSSALPGSSWPAASSRARSSAIGWRGSPRSRRSALLRRRRAFRLVASFRIVRGPRRIALAFALVARSHLQQAFQRAGRLVDALVAVAHALEAARHGGEREVARFGFGHFAPGERG